MIAKIISAVLLVVFVGVFIHCESTKMPSKIESVYTSFDQFEHELNKKNAKVNVVNFWATWCKPCIAELPYFEVLNTGMYKDQIEITLVTLDFEKHMESRVVPFLEKNPLYSRIVMLDDPKQHYWIDKVNQDWSGAIPATLFYTDNKSIFLEKQFHSSDEIIDVIKQLL